MMKENMRSDPEIIDGLIDDIYEAIDNSAVWGRVLKTLDMITGSSCSALLSMRNIKEKICGENLTTDGYEKNFIDYQAKLLLKDNVASIVKGFGTGKTISSFDFLGKGGAKTSTVYQEFYKKCDFVHFMGINLFISDDAWVGLVSFRGQHLFPHDAVDRQVFERIAPHILRSMKVSQIVSSRQAKTDAALDTIEKLHHAAFLLDDHRRVISMNGLGRALVEKGEMRISPSGVLEMDRSRIGRGDENGHFANGASTDARAVSATTLHGTRGRTGMMMFKLEGRWPSIFPSLSREASELVLVFDADARLASMVRHVRSEFGLTSAEARVYEAAMTHSTSYEIADSLGLSRETVRSHMKHIFLKTDISSHVELLQYFALRSTAE